MTIQTTTTLPTITLHSTIAGSDKLYQLTIVCAEEANTYNLVYANGRRTGTLTPGKKPKNTTPLTLDQATTELDNLKRHQTGRGYHELGNCSLCANEDVAPSDPTPSSTSQTVNASCQLLTLLPGSDDCRTLEEFLHVSHDLLNDPQYCAERKFDGIRVLLYLDAAGNVTPFNRTEEVRGISRAVINEIQMFRLNAPLMFDGESIGDKFHIFDLLEIQGINIRHLPFEQRNAQLGNLLNQAADLTALVPTKTCFSTADKTALLIQMFEEQKEGIVFKKLSAPYRSERARDQFKVKFVSEATFVVTEVKPKGKHSVTIGLLNEASQIVSAGHVSIRPCIKEVKTDDLLDVRYLYARRSSGHIVQAVAQRIRTDISREECTTAQLKYKEGE
jgi:bifunctional non-homologous end joining protein LigD